MTGWRRAGVWALLGGAGAFAFGNMSGVFRPIELPILMLVWAAFAGACGVLTDPRWISDDDE
ncbi:MAG: hypothetical protein DRJ50_04045 [Actinobacteria bacterium]|nr:MAG: hypothetical protein DRJ50_04045 [Actinomycetota bacterium]